MATASLLGLDQADFVGRLDANYRSSYVAWEGAQFKEPPPTVSGSAPADWIVPRLIRDESFAYNVENAQARQARFAVWIALQPERGDFQPRLDAIMTDLADALGLDRNTNSNLMDDTFSYLGPAEKPSGLQTSHRWEWRAVFFQGTFYQQVA